MSLKKVCESEKSLGIQKKNIHEYQKSWRIKNVNEIYHIFTNLKKILLIFLKKIVFTNYKKSLQS